MIVHQPMARIPKTRPMILLSERGRIPEIEEYGGKSEHQKREHRVAESTEGVVVCETGVACH